MQTIKDFLRTVYLEIKHSSAQVEREASTSKIGEQVRRSVVCEYMGAHSYAGRILTQLKTPPAAS